MKVKFFWIPARDSIAAESERNGFLTANRVIHIEQAFVASESAPGWSICVQRLQQGPGVTVGASKGRAAKVDYREVLDDATFEIYAVLRTWRKDRAVEQGVPVYTVATNEQLARIARDRIQSKSGLERVDGFRASRMEKYSEELIALCQQTMSDSPAESES